jgi:hypothetical protein
MAEFNSGSHVASALIAIDDDQGSRSPDRSLADIRDGSQAAIAASVPAPEPAVDALPFPQDDAVGNPRKRQRLDNSDKDKDNSDDQDDGEDKNDGEDHHQKPKKRFEIKYIENESRRRASVRTRSKHIMLVR